jgi:catechol 2,3-dioxygenase-like lactoylglutathione lyase family enzyme
MSTTASAQHIPGVGTVYLPVSDQDRALAFYRDLLGFEVRTDARFGEDYRWVEVAPAGAYTVIALVPPMGEEDPQPGGRAPFGFDTPDLEAAMTDLGLRGVEFEDVMGGEGPVPPMAYFHDPDGNRIMLVEETAR